jgi:hypothetical protein
MHDGRTTNQAINKSPGISDSNFILVPSSNTICFPKSGVKLDSRMNTGIAYLPHTDRRFSNRKSGFKRAREGALFLWHRQGDAAFLTTHFTNDFRAGWYCSYRPTTSSAQHVYCSIINQHWRPLQLPLGVLTSGFRLGFDLPFESARLAFP